MFPTKRVMAILLVGAEPLLTISIPTAIRSPPQARIRSTFLRCNQLRGASGHKRRNNLRQPGINNWDMGLQKSFKLFGEGRELQFRADSFNTFNHAQWSNRMPMMTVKSTRKVSLGTSPAVTGRHMQLNLKFAFEMLRG